MGTSHTTPGRRTPDFALSSDELRAVTAFASASAEEVLPLFEAFEPDDERPRQAVEAAAFVRGEPRRQAQRTTATAAHRAAKAATTPVAFHAAMAAGDAAASAYLHPLADAVQVNHILRATAHTVRACELRAEELGSPVIPLQSFVEHASPPVIDVLGRYPRIAPGRNRVGELVHELDTLLRRHDARPG